MKLLSLLIIILLIPLISAEIVNEEIVNEDVQLSNLYCSTEGVIGFKLIPIRNFGTAKVEEVLVKQAGKTKFLPIKGIWDRNNLVWNEYDIFKTSKFTSLEGEIKSSGTHELEVSYNLDNEIKKINVLFDCEGTKFTCRLFNIDVDSCESNKGVFTAIFNIKGINAYKEYSSVPKYSVDDLDIKLISEERFCDKEGNCGKKVGIPKGAIIETYDDKLKIIWDYQTNIKGVSINLPLAKICYNQETNYNFSISGFKNCDVDPFAKVFVCKGCEVGSICVLEGEKIIQDGESQYCVEGILSPQRATGSVCNSDIECKTGSCIANYCADELLNDCVQGVLTNACKCGEEKIRDWEGKSCCDGMINKGNCSIIEKKIVEKKICEEGYFLEENICVKIEEKIGFWHSLSNFFKGIFSRR